MIDTGGTSGGAVIDAVDQSNAIYEATPLESFLYQCGDPGEARTQRWTQAVKTASPAHACRRQLDVGTMIELRTNVLTYDTAIEKNFYAIFTELRPRPAR